MDFQRVKRGIDFANRMGQAGLTGKLSQHLQWWKGGRLDLITLSLILFVSIINLLLVLPILEHNLNLTAVYSSAALIMIGDFFGQFNLRDELFIWLTIVSLAFAPVGYYLFVLHMVFRHELTAFLATLLFILPRPFFENGLPLIDAILKGDGAHAFSFTFIPILLLPVQRFIAKNTFSFGLISICLLTLVAIISPFAFFNLLIICMILAISEGFLGNFRTKLKRLLLLILASLLLSLAWYYPNALSEATLLNYIQASLSKLWLIFPILIPIVPILGFLSFLIFDRSKKLQPVFVGVALFAIYLSLFLLSQSINIGGIFTAERYLIELGFASSFLLAMIFGFLIETVVRSYLLKIKNKILFWINIFLAVSVISALLLAIYLGIQLAHVNIRTPVTIEPRYQGIGSLGGRWEFDSIYSIIPSLVSLSTFVILLFWLWRSTHQQKRANDHHLSSS